MQSGKSIENRKSKIEKDAVSFTLPNRVETARWGEALGKRLQSGDVIALIGDLGAGKTTLTQSIARGMGITTPVTSPTYTLVQEYSGRVPLVHADPYRLENPADVLDFGFDEYFERGGVVIIEWANRIVELLPPERLTLQLEMTEEATEDVSDAPRTLTATANGLRYERLLKEMQRSLPESGR